MAAPRLDVKHAPPPTPPDSNDGEGKEAKEAVPDAGLRSLDHYKRALPRWRYSLRQRLLPLVRWETPYLAYFQSKVRTPALDSYFAITANLGTLTFFMVGLPILIWCGYPNVTKILVHLLASGVFFTGFIKDMCSLPRPLSPPLQRITMSGSAALEYGFPSTHSANAVSVTVYVLLALNSPDSTLSPTAKLVFTVLAWWYAISIVFGRLYCGMHGFLDVIFGSLFGALLAYIEFYGGPVLQTWMLASNWTAPALVALVVIVLVRVHPEPVDDCPCFDDSVAFAGVVMGLEAGMWRMAQSSLGPWYAGGAFSLSQLGWPAIIARVLLGVVAIFAWREVMKPSLLKTLPHLFRVIEKAGMSLPRRFFMPASEYKNIPLRLRVDNVMPSISDLPRLVSSFRHPGRGRSVSIGPQSAADAYETLAYRERRRRESIGSNASRKSGGDLFDLMEENGNANGNADGQGQGQGHGQGVKEKSGEETVAWSSANARYQFQPRSAEEKEPFPSFPPAVAQYEKMMGQTRLDNMEPMDENAFEGEGNESKDEKRPLLGGRVASEDELGEKELFSKLVKPRVRYDVEVVTKLIVYAGIPWLAAEFLPYLYELVGLGVKHLDLR